ncbi:unnamed protein product [Oikopleura dioica]|uniref:EF-hand domain-containing protein n=1 Tax=Oikopleura dioica TaxID=34765 RepID=E4YAL2_OIKDI|nr:unnamed protein product [Oikopleura dioica]
MSEFTEDQLDAFKDAFELFDRTGEGKIAWKDCASLARCFGYNPTNAFVLNLLSTGNPEEEPELPLTKQELEGNFVTLDEFLPHLWIVSQAPDPGSYEDFFEGLKVFDKHGDGNVSSAELRHVLSNLGEKLTGVEIDTLIGDQEDQFGNINYDKFIKTIMHDKEGSPED